MTKTTNYPPTIREIGEITRSTGTAEHRVKLPGALWIGRQVLRSKTYRGIDTRSIAAAESTEA